MDRYQTPLWAELVVIQSHPTNHHRDILKGVGLMDDEQFKQYVQEQGELIRDRHYQYRD